MSKKLVRLLGLVIILSLASDPAQASHEIGSGECPRIQSADPPEDAIHMVGRGETLFSIAKRYGSTVDALAHANGLADPTRIYVGQQLTVPGGWVERDPQSTTPYVVQVADTVASIARRHSTSWQTLAELNGLLSPNILCAGEVIQVPSLARPGGLGGAFHTVNGGETLFGIALRYDVSPWALARANKLENPALIFAGQRLLVPGEEAGRLPTPFVAVEVRPLPVRQGQTLAVGVSTTRPVTLTGRLLEGEVRFAQEGGAYYGLVGVPVFAEPGLYELPLVATEDDGRSTGISADVVVEDNQFGYERIRGSESLLDPAVVAAERERLNALRPRYTEVREWSGAFERPTGGTVSSYFGTHRAYNDGPYTSFHGGVDLRGPTGTPVHAPAGGTVVLAEELVVRGVAVVLDHGWGVLTGYWHLSEAEVQVGERVEQGDLIAQIGSTGLSTGSHLHWEMWVGGVNVDAMQWLRPFYPWGDGSGEPEG